MSDTNDGGPKSSTDEVRPELAELRERLGATTDAGRPDAVARRRKTGQRTARENIDDLVDPGSFVEYGGLALAAQRSTRSMEDLIRASPADGLVCGLGTVNRALFDDERARTRVM
ncbi:MAG TPA: carboxyl transferase domain-containing protein, partial [Archangium sp.]|nr:carboxyl transferase domain-containing protein [Archangium sp.]